MWRLCGTSSRFTPRLKHRTAGECPVGGVGLVGASSAVTHVVQRVAVGSVLPTAHGTVPSTSSAPKLQSRLDLAPTGQPGQHGNMLQRVAGTVGADAHTPRVATPASIVHRGLAITLVVLVLLQAVIAGQFLFGGWAIDLHGWIGNGSFALGVVLVVLAVRSAVGNRGVPVAVALVVAMFVQTGLGYAGRTALGAASWHVPLGVLIFGLAVVHATLLCGPVTGATPSTPATAASAEGSP